MKRHHQRPPAAHPLRPDSRSAILSSLLAVSAITGPIPRLLAAELQTSSAALAPASVAASQSKRRADGPASTPGRSAPGNDSAPEDAIQRGALQEVVVTAEKTREPLLDVPMSLSAITGTELQRAHSFRLEDYIQSVPGVSLIDYGGLGSQIVIRGITSGSIAINSAVATYIDETPFTSEGPFADSYIVSPDLDTFDLKRIEVLRGPQGTLYGANSLGGVVRYITNPPNPAHFSSTIEAGLSSVYNGSIGHSIHAMVNLPLSSKAAVRIVGYTNDYPGFIDDPSRGLKETNGSHYSGLRASLLYLPMHDLSIRLNALYQDRKWNDYSNEDVAAQTLAPIYAPLTEHELISNTGSRIVKLYNATVEWKTPIAHLLSATSYYSLEPHAQYEYPILNGTVSSLFGSAYPGAGVSFNEPLRALTEELRATSVEPGRLQWIGGFYFTNERASEDENLLPIAADHVLAYDFSPALGHFLIPVRYKEYAGYLHLDYTVLRNLDVAAGIRYSSNSQSFHETGIGLFAGGLSFGHTSSGAETTYSTDLRWHPVSHQMLYFRFAEGFAPGGPNDDFTGSSLPTTYASSTTTSYEAGLKSQLLQRRLTAQLSAFHIVWDKIQLQAVVNGFGGIVNGGSAASNGFEWELSLTPLHGLDLAFEGSYTNAHLTENTPVSVNGVSGDRLPGVPLWSGGVHAQYSRPLSDGYAAFGAFRWQFTGNRYSDFIAGSPRQHLPSFGFIDLRAGVRAARWSATLYVKNLANRIAINYVQPETLTGGLGPQDATVYPPRTIGFSVVYHVR